MSNIGVRMNMVVSVFRWVLREGVEIEGGVKRMAKIKGWYFGITSVWVIKMGCMTSLCELISLYVYMCIVLKYLCVWYGPK